MLLYQRVWGMVCDWIYNTGLNILQQYWDHFYNTTGVEIVFGWNSTIVYNSSLSVAVYPTPLSIWIPTLLKSILGMVDLLDLLHPAFHGI